MKFSAAFGLELVTTFQAARPPLIWSIEPNSRATLNGSEKLVETVAPSPIWLVDALRTEIRVVGSKRHTNDGWSVGKHAAQIIAEPVRGDFTSAGLPTRVPRANLIPGSAGGRSAAGAPSRPGSGPDGQAPVTPRSPRSPDVARNRLSGFQRGVRRAKGVTPDDGEGADR